MSDDTPRNVIEPDGPADRNRNSGNPDNPGNRENPAIAEGPDRVLSERGMPELGQHGSGRPRAWWLTPLVIVAVVVAGAVWTVHGFMARHDAAAQARRDAALDQKVQGRIFGDGPASAASMSASAAHPASAPVGQGLPASAVVVTRSPANSARVPTGRSYYDAPLLATGGSSSSGTLESGTTGTPAPPSVPGIVSTPTAEHGQAGSPLGQALTPTLTPRVTAGLLGNRSLILAQGAKIDCVGDTAFDSTEAGISTCTVTRNVYSDNGRVLLIERGSQINSEYRSNLSPGQTRVFVLSARIRTPHGVTVEIDSPAADALGRMGVGGYPDSVVVLDIKQENYNVTAGFRRAHGQAVYLFNPFAEDGRTHRYNPLSAISGGVFRVGDILAIGYALYPVGGHDDFWKDQARNLFLGIVLLLCEWWDARRTGNVDVPDHPVTMGEVLRQSSGDGMPVKVYLQRVLLQHRSFLSAPCVDALNRFLANDDKVLASVLATFNAPLTIWASPIVDAATSANDFDLRDVRKRRMSVYIGITPDHLTEAALLVNLVFSQLVNLNTRELPEANPALKFQCLLLMDEFTAIGKIQIIARAVAYMAGFNLRMLSIVQSVSQLESVYGRADARTFVTNHAMQILYAPREQKDANEYSEMLGTFTDKSRSVSRSNVIFGGRGGSSESISDQRRPLLLPQELKELGRAKEIILLENTKPILADKICYWRDAAFTSRLAAPPKVAAMDLARFAAQTERRLRDLDPSEVDAAGVGLINVPVEYLEVLQAWDPHELPAHLAELSEDDVSAYVERHFMLLGVPRNRIVAARHTLSLSELDVAELRPAPVARNRRTGGNAGGVKQGASPAARADRNAGRRRESRLESMHESKHESNVVPIKGDC